MSAGLLCSGGQEPGRYGSHPVLTMMLVSRAIVAAVAGRADPIKAASCEEHDSGERNERRLVAMGPLAIRGFEMSVAARLSNPCTARFPWRGDVSVLVVHVEVSETTAGLCA